MSEHLWGSWNEKGWKITDEHIGDTAFFGRRSAPDSIYRIEGQWYHNVGGWTPPDSIRNPYRRITRYYILDLRTFRKHARGSREGTMEWLETLQDFVHEYATEDAYAEARRRLEVPDSLDFSVRIECME